MKKFQVINLYIHICFLFQEKLGEYQRCNPNYVGHGCPFGMNIPPTDATPAIQTILQCVRQQYEDAASKHNLPSPKEESTHNTASHYTERILKSIKVEPVTSLSLPISEGNISIIPSNPTITTKMFSDQKSICTSLQPLPTVITLNTDTSLIPTSFLSSLAWHMQMTKQESKKKNSNTIHHLVDSDLGKVCNVQQNTQNTITYGSSALETEKVCPLKNLFSEIGHSIKNDQESSGTLLESLDALAFSKGHATLHNQIVIEHNLSNSESVSNLDNLDLSFSSSYKSTELNETATPSTITPSPVCTSAANIRDDINQCSVDTLKNRCSPYSNINLALLESFQERDHDMDNTTDGNDIKSLTDACRKKTPSLGRVHPSRDFYLTPSFANDLVPLSSYTSPTNETRNIFFEGKSTSPFDYVGQGQSSSYSTESSSQSPWHIATDVPSFQETKQFIPSISTRLGLMPQISPNLSVESSMSLCLTPPVKTLDNIQRLDIQPLLSIPPLINDSMLSKSTDKCYNLTSHDFGPMVSNTAGPSILPSLDHPLDFENLMDLDSLPFLR